jgi:diguanylate cyclase (GGDEF)-like protein/PAS domain S-box-containing protein
VAFANSIRRRLDAARRSLSDGSDPRASMAAALLLLFAAGTVLALVSIPLADQLSGREKLAELVVCDLAAVACLLIALGWRRLSPLGFQLFTAFGTLIVSAGTYFASSGPNDAEVFYVWVAVYAAYFFTRRQAFLQVAIIGICYAAVLALGKDSGQGAARWLITMGSLVVTTLLFGYIKELLDQRLAERERSERQLEGSLSMLRATLESTADGILVVDRGGRPVSYNQRFKQMWSVPEGMLEADHRERRLGFLADQLLQPDEFTRRVEELTRRPAAEGHDILRFKDGRVVERYSRPQRGADGEIHGRVWSFRDVTERERIEARLRYLADHDPLTGVLNRRRFEKELAERVAQASRYGGGGAVLLLDIDNFKEVNDSLGHHAGDAVIRSVAKLLREDLRETDVLARLGGDELAVLLPFAGTEQARGVAGKLVDTVRSHRVAYKGNHLRVTTSVGVAPISRLRTQSAEELLIEADIAVYEAKAAGKDRLRIYAPAADRRPMAAPLPR